MDFSEIFYWGLLSKSVKTPPPLPPDWVKTEQKYLAFYVTT